MMGKLLLFSLFLTVILGILIQAKLTFPELLAWVGKLPGDLLIKKEGALIYFPLTSSFLFSCLGSFFLYLLLGKKKK